MKLHETIKSWCLSLALVGLLLWGTTLHAAVPPSWKDGGFSINANGMTVRGVLEDFSRTYGVRLQMTSDGGLVKSRLKGDNGVDFLNRLSGQYKFRWFVYSDTLYVVPTSDNTSARLQVGENAVQDAKNALVGLGLFDERFGWGELPDEGVVIVSGPRAYVDLAREVLMPDGKKERLRGRQVMLFRLKYASAMDRVINSRGKSETIPGIKSILSNLMLGGGHSSEKLTGPGKFDAASTKRSRTGKNGRGEAREVAQEGSNNRFVPLFSAPGADGRNNLTSQVEVEDQGGGGHGSEGETKQPPRIEADPTLNAIMIYDDIAKKDIYQSLINQLDVKPQQIEIEALIVDIDRSKLAEMGVEWGARAGVVNTTVNGTTTQSSGTDLPLPGATLLISDAARFYARLKAMESNGEARVLATPTVLTLDNVAAVLDLSQSAYVSLVGERVADMSDITAGTMLRVIPRIINDAGDTRVRLEVDIEDGSLNNDSNSSGSSNSNNNNGSGTIAASVTRSTINTQAIIDAQQTLMIGGYRAESLIRNKQKVPVLGDLPVLGGLFRSESRSNSTRERLFLITPRITGFDGTRMAMNNPRGKAAATPAPAPVPAAPTGMPAVPVPGPTTGPTPGAQALPPPAGASTTPPALLPLPASAPGGASKPQASEAAPTAEPQLASSAPQDGSLMGVHLPLRRTKNRCARPGSVGMM
ncbi:type III secretion system outer membrane ring subunit SctC [Herbaspirillum sp. YR522]|uniref:type III secretion system outer membrane ring subunit SctC n=1 Tax=Herbaspirillum sp. YR522 TaxID=1144342 RepID=UPI00026F99EA|nr:type III secretion system outer membrane ring subunit SctC [Herbaspirillum sp. YR522]EJN02933.1 type III secretion outer membrane pore, YscC/HrcC family [Herbaspirillum sp. YR522]